MKKTDLNPKPPVSAKYIFKLQIGFLIFFCLLQAGFYYKNGLLIVISFVASFLLGLTWVFLLIKKNRFDKKREKQLEEEFNSATNTTSDKIEL